MLFLWFLFLLLTPLYLFPSGLPQIADLLMVGLCAGVALGGRIRIPRSARVLIVAAFAFVSYTVVVNASWALAIGDPGMLMPSIYYFYNALAMGVALQLRATYSERFWKATFWGLMGAFLYLVFLSLGSTPGRFMGTFNNPNQLGYFALLGTIILYIVLEKIGRSSAYKVVALAMGSYLSAMSLSRAAIGAMALMIGIVVVVGLWERERFKTAVGIMIVGALLFQFAQSSALVQRVENRFAVSKGDESLEGRGYDRIARFPSMIVLGAGEGGLERFADNGRMMEIHSTPGTVLFSYGIPGSLLFIALLSASVLRTTVHYAVLLVPVLFYGLTHQGLRVTLLWILLAIMPTEAREYKTLSPQLRVTVT